MKTQNAHAHEDRLLDFAYDELPLTEAHAVEQHLQGCSRCAETLRGIRGVRRSMARLPQEAAPEAGLDSLLAYAQQSARRAAAGAEPAPRWWRRLMAPALSMAAVSVFGLVVLQVNRDVDLSPSLQSKGPAQKSTAMEPPSRAKAEVAQAPAPAPAAVPAQSPLLAEAAPLATPQRADKSSYASSRDQMAKSKPLPAARGWAVGGKGSAQAGMGGSAPKKKRAMDSDDSLFDQRAESLQGISSAEASAPPPPADSDSLQKDSVGRAFAGSPPPPAAPASPPPRVASASPRPEPSTAGVDSEEREAAEGISAPGGRAASRASPSPAELVRQADLALRSGDRSQEIVFLRAALAAGVQGSQALTVLSRLCDAESTLGRRRNAIEVCKRVMATAPNSSEARSALRVLEEQLRVAEPEAGGEVEKR
ncbi:hypothetical protein CYFUS_006058 [Cystobacter fuscus]|uniref:Putative zinc-finger domain-containing protein n=1 Tax=Cystobacter fuscus TaxID=43 RepID=A0A250JAS4_9BACT|nr:zf-HC2 domain-containing protein [Cystobacter fuscus]ATB40607.1 hypothetical protein CYFUS_006058 [Cystobacter fuscus]